MATSYPQADVYSHQGFVEIALRNHNDKIVNSFQISNRNLPFFIFLLKHHLDNQTKQPTHNPELN